MSNPQNSVNDAEYDIVQQLMALKDLTQRFNCIEEIQKRQLIGYGQIIPNIKGNSVEVHINMDNRIVHIKAESEISEKTKQPKFRKTKRVKELFPNITEWVRFVVWDNAVVIISVDNTLMWDSRNV